MEELSLEGLVAAFDNLKANPRANDVSTTDQAANIFIELCKDELKEAKIEVVTNEKGFVALRRKGEYIYLRVYNKADVKPMGDYLVIEREEAKKKTDSGLAIPDMVADKNRPNFGMVRFAGDGFPDRPAKVKSGDRVCFQPHAGVEVEMEGKKMLIMRETEIYFIDNGAK